MSDTAKPQDNAFAYLRGAASGDLPSMRSLVQLGLKQMGEEPDLPTAIETMMIARMAAAVGNLGDAGALMCALAVTIDHLDGQQDCAGYIAQLQGEGIAVLNRLADAGVEVAEHLLPTIVEDAGPLASAIAKDFSARMAAIEGGA